MGGCQKLSTFPITIITGWVGVGKNGNCQLLFITFFQMFFFCTLVVKRCFQKKNKVISVFKPQLSIFKNFFVARLFQVESYKTIKIKQRRIFLLAKVSLFLTFLFLSLVFKNSLSPKICCCGVLPKTFTAPKSKKHTNLAIYREIFSLFPTTYKNIKARPKY